MIGANDLTWDDVVRVGPGTRGGEYLMIREGVVDVANGRRPQGVLEKDLDFIDLDIGDKDYELHELPEILADLTPAVKNLLQEGTRS